VELEHGLPRFIDTQYSARMELDERKSLALVNVFCGPGFQAVDLENEACRSCLRSYYWENNGVYLGGEEDAVDRNTGESGESGGGEGEPGGVDTGPKWCVPIDVES